MKQYNPANFPVAYKIIGFVLVMYILGSILIATGTPPGLVGFSVFLPMTLLLSVTVAYIIISFLYKCLISRRKR